MSGAARSLWTLSVPRAVHQETQDPRDYGKRLTERLEEKDPLSHPTEDLPLGHPQGNGPSLSHAPGSKRPQEP